MSPVDLRGRHYQAGPKGPQSWKCVACGADNSGPLEQGCAACHSGEPGRHVGVPPTAQLRNVVGMVHGHVHDDGRIVQTPMVDLGTADTADEAFLRWRKEQELPENVLAVLSYVYDAFVAGFKAGIGQVSQMATPLAGTAESRTVIAALRMFLENVLPTATEEIQSGEFLSIEATQALIQRLERTNG